MPYFTSWDANVFLCLVDKGLSLDLVRDFTVKIKKTHEEFTLKNARDYYCDRSQFVDMDGIEMLYFSRACLSDPFYHFPKAIQNLVSIPIEYHSKHYYVWEHNRSGVSIDYGDVHEIWEE